MQTMVGKMHKEGRKKERKQAKAANRKCSCALGGMWHSESGSKVLQVMLSCYFKLFLIAS